MQISRLFEMLYVLLENERVSAASLAKRLEVSVRTVYRDAQTLSEAGIPVYAEHGRNGGLLILPTFKLSKALLNEQERQMILASLHAMAQAGADEEAALRKLTAFFGVGTPDWVQIDLSDWGATDTLLPIIKAAILEKHMLEFDYYGEYGEKRSRRACPMKLWFKAHAWYLLAFCLERQALRVFKLTRIKHAQIVPGTFPENLPACEWPNAVSPSDTPIIAFTLHIDRSMAFRVYDDFDEEQITTLKDGSFLEKASFPQGGWVLSFILGYGTHAQIVEPLSLKKEIADMLENMLSLYKC